MIVVLCGSTRFYDTYALAAEQESARGHIVLMSGVNLRDRKCLKRLFAQGYTDDILSGKLVAMLNEVQKQMIDMADEVLIIDPCGYIGESTEAEIKYAIGQRKRIRYWSDESGE